MIRSKIVICANHGGFGGSYSLNQAINLYSNKYESDLITDCTSPYGFGNGKSPRNHFDEVDSLLSDTTRLFICDYQGLSAIARYLSIKNKRKISHKLRDSVGIGVIRKWLLKKQVVFFWTGTIYMLNAPMINAFAASVGCRCRFAMCDLLRCDNGAKPLYQPIGSLPSGSEKFANFTLCHSPGLKYKYGSGKGGKGSDVIEKAFAELAATDGVAFYVLKGVPYSEAIETKAKSHVFVDQITPTIGGVGKSGLEALRMGVPTLGDVHNCSFVDYYKGCPIKHVADSKHIVKYVRRFILDKDCYLEASVAAAAWGKKLGYQETASYLDSEIEW